jgi:hypothetical protein
MEQINTSSGITRLEVQGANRRQSGRLSRSTTGWLLTRIHDTWCTAFARKWKTYLCKTRRVCRLVPPSPRPGSVLSAFLSAVWRGTRTFARWALEKPMSVVDAQRACASTAAAGGFRLLPWFCLPRARLLPCALGPYPRPYTSQVHQRCDANVVALPWVPILTSWPG